MNKILHIYIFFRIMKRLFTIFGLGVFFISFSQTINIKINGTAMPINQQAMDSNSVVNLLYEVLTDRQKKEEPAARPDSPGAGSDRRRKCRPRGRRVRRRPPRLSPGWSPLLSGRWSTCASRCFSSRYLLGRLRAAHVSWVQYRGNMWGKCERANMKSWCRTRCTASRIAGACWRW